MTPSASLSVGYGCIRSYRLTNGTRIVGEVTSNAPICRLFTPSLIISVILRRLCVKRIRMSGKDWEVGLKKDMRLRWVAL